MKARVPSLLIWAALVVGACGPSSPPPAAATATPAPPSAGCGGSHDWPPNGYPAASGVTAQRVSATSARLGNTSSGTRWYAATAWFDGGCTGWMATQPEARGSLAVGASADVSVTDPNNGLPFRIGIELWDHPCDEACTDDPTGFVWVPGTDAAATSSP